MEVFTKANEALFAAHGTVFVVGNAHDTIYPTSGTARDWGKGVAGVKYTTGIELRDEGQYGFLLPEEQGSECIHQTSRGVLTFEPGYCVDDTSVM